MKQFLVLILLTGALAACGDKSSKSTTTGPESAPSSPGMDNVHGNVPDTSTSIQLNNTQPVDSSATKDSLRR